MPFFYKADKVKIPEIAVSIFQPAMVYLQNGFTNDLLNVVSDFQ